MKLIIVALAMVAMAAAAPVDEPKTKILRSEYDQNPDGGYAFGYETDDGSKRDELAEVKEGVDEEKKPVTWLNVRGTYSYYDAEKQVHTVEYYADETGFHATGEDIPKNPESRR